MYCTGEGYNMLIYYVLYRRGIQRADILCTVQERDTACCLREDQAGCVQTQKSECKAASGGVAAVPAVAKHKWVRHKSKRDYTN